MQLRFLYHISLCIDYDEKKMKSHLVIILKMDTISIQRSKLQAQEYKAL